MGWWECYDNTVIGDELSDLVGDWIDKLVAELVEKYSEITRNQVLHTFAFCSGYLKHFDKDRQLNYTSDKILAVMSINQRRKWDNENKDLPDISKRVAPGTSLRNVRNPFTDDLT